MNKISDEKSYIRFLLKRFNNDPTEAFDEAETYVRAKIQEDLLQERRRLLRQAIINIQAMTKDDMKEWLQSELDDVESRIEHLITKPEEQDNADC